MFLSAVSRLKGIDHPKMKMVPNMYEFLSSAEHKRRYFEEYG